MEPADDPRVTHDAATALAGEDLAPYSQDELTARIAQLETEIDRVRTHRDRAAKHREAADLLFGKGA